MIGAGVRLYQIYKVSDPTKAASYLTRAKAIAAMALDHYAQVGYVTQDPAFNAIFFRNLLLLTSEDATALNATLAALQGYVDQAWANNRDANNLYYFPVGDSSASSLDQGALVEMNACLAWVPSVNGSYDLLV